MSDNAVCHNGHSHTCPSFNSTLLDAENKDGARLDHGSAFSVIESAGNARDNSLTSGMD